MSSTGLLSFLVAPDFENPTDLGDVAGNNTYAIRVQAENSSNLTVERSFIITVKDIDESSPIITITAPIKLSNLPITGTVKVTDDVAIQSGNVSWVTDPVGNISSRNCVQTDERTVDCDWTLSAS